MDISKKRDYRVDNLRAIGILCIILAHCGAPNLLHNIRSFDVILLVFISASMYKENIAVKNDVIKYCKKKIKRLLVPTYCFIIIFTCFLYVAYRVVDRLDLLGIKQIFNSFLLCEDSIGYVWVMKVYLVNALLAPVMSYFQKKITHTILYIISIVCELVLYMGALYIYNQMPYSWLGWVLVNEWFLLCFAYGIVAQDALWCKKNDWWGKYGWIIWFGVFVLTCFNSSFVFEPAVAKRPVQLHYLSYGLACTGLLRQIIPNKRNSLLTWISCNSMEVYFVHPFILVGVSAINKYVVFPAGAEWWITWLVVLTLSIGTVWFLKYLKKYNYKRIKEVLFEKR